MSSSHLSLPIRLPFEDQDRHARLDTLTAYVADTLIERYWTPEHLTGIVDYSYQAWKYFDEAEAFADVDLYLPSRYKRCVMQKVEETLRSHADKREAFQSIQSVLPTHKIRRIDTRRIKERLWESEEYIKSGYVDLLIGQLNSYYDCHGRFPESYFDMQECPSYSNGVLPYSADDGPKRGQAVKYEYDEDTQKLTVKLKTPDSIEPETQGDWTWTEHTLESYEAFHELLEHGTLSAPSFQPAQTKTGDAYYELSFPIEVEHQKKPADVETVLAIDSGLRKDATAVVVNEEGKQLSVPYFIQNAERERIKNLARERNRLNSKLAYLRQEGRDHTDDFKHVQAEYERVNNRICHKREQLIHDVANQILALALVYDVDAIVHEDLRSLSPPRGEGQLSWELSSWARREIISKIEYRADIAGLHVKRVRPGNTSRSCPRCGATGHTTKSPDHFHEVWWGGHFRCDNARCGYQADRDYVGAVNVARVFFSESATLEHDFTSSYIGDSEIVPASRSAGERSAALRSTSDVTSDPGIRLAFGTAPIVFTGQSDQDVTAGGGSCFIAPAVTPTETKNHSGNPDSASSPAMLGVTRFARVTTNCYQKSERYHHEPGSISEEPYSEEALHPAFDAPHQQDHLDEEDRYAARYGKDRRDRETVERVFDRVVYALLPVKSRFEAIAKAAVAFEYAPLVEDIPAAYDIDEHGPLVELASTFDEDARRTLAGELGDLPEATPVISEEGQRLFADARARTVWRDGDGPRNKQANELSSRTATSGKPVLVDEFGTVLDHWSQLLDRLEETPVPDVGSSETAADEHGAAENTSAFGSREPTLWIVPGFAFRAEKVSPRPVADPVGNNRELLACDICKTETVHKLATVERLEEKSETSNHPASELSDEYVSEHIWELEIWECTRCGAPRS